MSGERAELVGFELDDDGVALVRMDRPPVNAFDLELMRAVAGAMRDAVDAGARAIVLTGAGRSFCGGIDVKLAPTLDARQRREAIDALNAMVAAVCSVALPVVAAINGHAMGGGVVIALACDVRVAARGEHRLALNEVAAGVPFPAGPLAIVRAELDPSSMRDLCLSGRTVGPEEALSLRLVDELADADRLPERARALALELAALPAYATVKAQVRGPVIAELERIVADGSGAAPAGPLRQG